MPMTLELPDELVEQLSREATRRNLSVNEYALRLLASGNPREFKFPDGASAVAYWEANGVLGSRTDIVDSQAEARRLREQVQIRGE